MIYGCIDEFEQWNFLQGNPVWAEAFSWLRSVSPDSIPGRYPIRGDDVFGLVMAYKTVAPVESKFESHRKYVDLQFTISGGEKIAFTRSTELVPDGGYDAVSDLQFYKYQETQSVVHKTAGRFSIYFPSDAHLPKIADGHHDEVFKAVVKISKHLLA